MNYLLAYVFLNEFVIMLIKIVFLFKVGLFSCLIAFQAYSQSSGALHLSTGIQDFTTRDQGFSSMNYGGIRTASKAIFQLNKAHKTELFQFEFAYGNLKNRIGNSLNGMSIGLLNHTFYHRNKPLERKLHWGWSNQNVFHIRSHNGFSNYSLRYDYLTAFGPSARYLWPFQWEEQRFEWETIAHLQVLGFQIKSGYIGADPEGFSEENAATGNFLKSMKPFIIGRDWSMGLNSSLYWSLPSENSLGLRYGLSMMALNEGQPVSRFGSALELVLKVKLW